MTVPTAIPCSWERVLALGSGVLGGISPEVILSRSRSLAAGTRAARPSGRWSWLQGKDGLVIPVIRVNQVNLVVPPESDQPSRTRATAETDRDGALAMEDAHHAGPPADADEHAAGLAEVQANHSSWRCWEGVVADVLYARRILSSPPRVVRAVSVATLAQAIEDDERQRGER